MKPHHWSMLETQAGSKPREVPQSEPEMDSRLEVLKNKWEGRDPDTQVSVINHEGDLVFMGRYYEGVVIRLYGPDGPVTFLTTEMAKQFGECLVGNPSQKG